MSNYDVCYPIFNFVRKRIYYIWDQILENNSRNLESLVIIGPLWVKYGGKSAYQPPAAQNPGNAPECCVLFFLFPKFMSNGSKGFCQVELIIPLFSPSFQ